MIDMPNRILVASAALVVLAACETTEGYRQQVSAWQGRTGDDLLIEWGAPDAKATLSDGRELWSYEKSVRQQTGGYYRDETRQVTRTVTDSNGKQRTETISETYPVWEPPQSFEAHCETRFILSRSGRVDQISFDGSACVAPERN